MQLYWAPKTRSIRILWLLEEIGRPYERVVDVLEQAVADGPWLQGETFTAADVMIGADLHFGMVAFRIIEPRPALTAYVERCQARPAWKRAVAIDEAG